MYKINVRENRRSNQEWTIHSHWQHWTHKTQDEDKQNTNTYHRKLKGSATRTPPKTVVNLCEGQDVVDTTYNTQTNTNNIHSI